MNLFNMLTCEYGFDPIIPGTIRLVVKILKIAIPIILIIYGMLDISKAVMANDEKEMKEAQKKLIHRIVYAVIVFFVIALVQFVFARLAEASAESDNSINKTSISDCIACFVSDEQYCKND